MTEIKGEFNKAICYCKTLEEKAGEQIKTLCDQEVFQDSKIRIMPDVHAGMGCTIGTTMTIKDKVVPAMVGVDIGCGMETTLIEEKEIDFEKLDKVIRYHIPCGRDIRKRPHPMLEEIDLNELRCCEKVSIDRAERSIGTLGGGNHFIEVDKDEEGTLYLVIHSGSRHLGNEVAKYYQNEGYRYLCGNSEIQIKGAIKRLKDEGREKDIEKTIAYMKSKLKADIPKDLAYVEGSLFDDYINDMKIIQHFAMLNRKAMTDIIVKEMGFTVVDSFTTIHNYIDIESMILRKGSVSAQKGEKLLIPINMRDGSLICIGKGNKDWNCSAPHGAGRLMSRKEAFRVLSLDQYKEEMSGIFSTCIEKDTLDESPMAYKDMNEIIEQIEPTAQIIKRIRPVYNFKAKE